MATQVKVGTVLINSTDIVGTNIDVTAPGFTPTVTILTWNGRSDAADAAGNLTHNLGIGWGVSATDRRAIGTRSQDGAANAIADSGQVDDACVLEMANGASAGKADYSVLAGQGFRLTIDVQFTGSLRVHYKCIGGDVSFAKTGEFTPAGAAPADQDITDVGQQGDCVLFMSASILADGNAIDVDSHFMLGAAAGPSNQWVVAGVSNDAEPSMVTANYGIGSECIAMFSQAGAAMANRATFVSWLSNGFRINWTERGNARRVQYLVLKGGSFLVGDSLTRADSTPFSVTGLAGTPRGVLIAGTAAPESAADTLDAGDKLELGLGTSATERVAIGINDRNGLATSVVNTIVEYDSILASVGGAGALLYTMDINSVLSNGFEFVMDTPSASPFFFGYVFVGDTPAAGAAGRIYGAGVRMNQFFGTPQVF